MNSSEQSENPDGRKKEMAYSHPALLLALRRYQPRNFPWIGHAMFLLIRKDLLAIHQNFHFVHGQAHLGLNGKLLFDFFFEAPGLFTDFSSKQSTFNFDLHFSPLIP